MMMKVKEPSHLLEKSGESDHERIRVFYRTSYSTIEEYKKYCTNKSYVDFD
jgi:ERCC4-type nuclease